MRAVRAAASGHSTGVLRCAPLSQLAADEVVDRFALGGARVDQLLEFGGRSLSEGLILEGRGIDVDVERGAAQCRIPGQHADAAVADDVAIAVFAGAPRQLDYLGADPRAVQRRFGGTAEARLDGCGAPCFF